MGQGTTSGSVDLDVLAGKSAKYVGAFIGVMVGLVSLPMFSEQSPLRTLVAAGLAGAAALAIASAFRLCRKGDPTEGTARGVVGLLFAIAGIWFSNLFPTPAGIQAPAVAGQVNDAIRTVAVGVPREGLGRRLAFTVYEPEGPATRLKSPFEDALSAEMARRPLAEGARAVSAGVRLTARAGSLAGGQVTATAHVALAAHDAPVCRFTVSIPQPTPLAAAAERLAKRAVDRAQIYVEGSDAC